MKFILTICICFLYHLCGWSQVNNPELTDLSNSCPASSWDNVGVTGCYLIDIDDDWIYPGTGGQFTLPASQIAPNASPGDQVWVTFENTGGQFGGITQIIGPLSIGNTYCMQFNATVNRLFTNTSSLDVRLDIDGVPSDSHRFVFGDLLQPVSLCFEATAKVHEMTIRTELISGLTTFLLIEEGSGAFVDLGSNCINHLVVSGNPVLQGSYQANKSLSCSDPLSGNSINAFTAGQEINLLPGFSVPFNSSLHAEIASCQ